MLTISLNAAVNQASDCRLHTFSGFYMVPGICYLFVRRFGKAFNVIWIYKLIVVLFIF